MFISDSHGPDAERAVAMLAPGDIAILENTRFEKGEEKNDPALADAVARLGDFYVNDAFSAAHRAHMSTEGLAHRLPAYAGRSMQAELEALEKALGAPERPVAAVVGGAKVSTKLDVLMHLVEKIGRAHTSELQSLMRISYAVFCLKKTKNMYTHEVK